MLPKERDGLQVITLLGSGVALLVGVVIATQPTLTVYIMFSVLIMAILAAITPITILILLLILSPMRTLIITESALQLPLDIGQLLLFVFLGVWFAHKTAKKQRIIRLSWSDLYFTLVAWVIIAGLTAFNAFSLGVWLTEWLKWVIILILMTLVLNIAFGWRWLVFGLTMAGVANAIIGAYIFTGGSGALHLLINDRFFRAFGTFGQPNPFGGFMGLIAPLALMAAYGYLLRFWRNRRDYTALSLMLFYAGSAGIIIMGVFISWSRGAWLAFGVSMLVIVLTLPRRLWQGMLLISVIGLIIGAAWSAGRLPASIVDRLSSATQELFVLSDVRAVDITPDNYAIVERLSHWQAAINMAQHHPWLGVGMGNYQVAYEQYRLINWHEPLGHAHNYYLNVFAEAGIIGLMLYLVFLFSILRFSWHLRTHPDTLKRAIGIGLLGTWTYLIVHSLTDNLYVNNLFIHIGIMLGLLAALHRDLSERTSIMR